MLLPSVLVVVFTPNSQSLTGIEHLVRRAMSYRESGADSRELRIYPLPSRVDNQVEHFRQVWRMGDPHHSLFGTVTGYQPLFERVFETMIASGGLDASAQLGEYFDAVQIPHTADYAYGERLCFVSAASADNLSIRNSFEQFLPWIATGAQPWERPAEVTLNQQATRWLRDSGADQEPVEESGWHAWYERLAQVLRTPENPVIHDYASLAPDTRVDTCIVLALAYAYQGDGAAATEWIRRAVDAYDDNVAVSLCTTAPLQLLRLWTDALAADEFTPELEAWVSEVDAWMRRWQPLKTERRQWLFALVELARERRLYEVLWHAQAELDGDESPAVLQSMAIFVDVLCDRGDFERARHVQMQLLEIRSQALGDDDPATIEARLKLEAMRAKRVSVGGATPRALRDCRYSAYISYAVQDDRAWNHWVTSFASELDMTLRSRLRGHTPPPIHLAGSDADLHGELVASLRERLAASFCMVIVVHDNYVFSDFCMQELAVFCELYGEQGLRERLFVVAISRSAIEQLYRNPDWKRITRREELVWLPFYKEDNPDVPVQQYVDAGTGIASSAFWAAFVRLRELMVDLMRRSLHEREHESLSSFPNLRGTDEKPLESVSIYIESNQRERVLWKALGELLVKRWDLAVSALAPNRSPRLRTRGLPMDDLDQYPALADADGIVLLWGLKTADTLLAQINNVESKLPGNDLVPGIVAYLMPPQMNPNRPLPAWGWEVLRFNTESDQQIDVVHEELEDLDRFLGDVLRRKLSVFTSQGVATRALM